MFQRNKLSIAVMLAMGGVVSLSAQAQQSQRVEITGSSIKRADAETALPVTTITKAEIDRTGATTEQDLVALIPSVFGGFVAANNVGANGVASTAALRGLPGKYTLVLLNGRRVANYAFGNSPVDLNSIPLSAVERVEVLRDGASAIYGADAVAGVINFILRSDYQGGEISGYATKVDQGGGDSTVVNITAGYGDLATQRFNFLISANHEKDDSLKAKDRSFANTANRPDLGINKASPRNGVPNLNFTDTKGNKYVGVNPYRYVDCKNDEFALVTISPTQCGTDYVKFIDLIPEQKHDSILARGVFQLNDNNRVYAEAMHVEDSTVATYSPAPYTRAMVYPANGRFYPKSITLPKGMTLPAGYIMPDGTKLAAATVLAADLTVTPTGNVTGTWRTVAGGGRTDLTETKTNRILIGAKGTLGDWDYDTAFTQSKHEGVISFGPGKFSYTKLDPLLATGSINVFGSQDATSLAALQSAFLTGPEQSAQSKSTEIDIRLSRDLFQMPAGPVGFAVGASFRKEELAQISYPVLASGDEVGGAGEIPSVTGDRKVYGLFTEASIPITKELEAQVAARYDNYKNGFGTSFNKVSPKASLRFQPMKELLARASVGTGYRAPTLYENLRPFTINNTAANWSDPIRCPGGKPITNTINPVGELQDECAVQLTSGIEGSPALRPEKSKQYSLGVVFSPSANLTASIDYWDVRISDAIVFKSEIQVMQNPDQFKDFIYRYDPKNFPNGYTTGKAGTVAGSQNKDFPIAFIYLPYDNQAKYFAAGLDLNVAWRMKLEGVGQVGLNIDGTYYTKHGYQNFGSPKVSDIGEYKDFGPVPRWRHAATVSYATGPINVSLTNNYTSGYNDYTNLDAVDGTTYPLTRKVSAYTTWDAQLGWKPIKNLDLVFGVKNIFDQDPPSSRTEVNFQTGYDAQFTNPLGRTYYVRAKYKFW